MANEKSFEDLYRSRGGQVYRFALRLCANREDAEDLAAETFAAAFENWNKYRGEASPGTWLYSIALNKWRMVRRRKTVRLVGPDAIDTVSESFNFAELELVEAILNLPEKLKEAFLLVKGEGLTHAEAAKAVGVPTGTMYFRVHRAVLRLRSELQPQASTREPQMEAACEKEMSIDPI